jgi:hypothetical protein
LGVGSKFDIEFEYDFGMGSKSFVIKSECEGEDSSSCETKYMDALSIVEGNRSVREARAKKEREEISQNSFAQKGDDRLSQKHLSCIQIKQHSSVEEVEMEIPHNSKSLLTQVSQLSRNDHTTGSGRPPLATSCSSAGEERDTASLMKQRLAETQQYLKESRVQLKVTQRELLDSQGELRNIREKAHFVKHELTNFKAEWESQQRQASSRDAELIKYIFFNINYVRINPSAAC